jgi:hypothetical protein
MRFKDLNKLSASSWMAVTLALIVVIGLVDY